MCDVIDPDAVETALFGEGTDDRDRDREPGGHVEFEYRDCLVRVGRDG